MENEPEQQFTNSIEKKPIQKETLKTEVPQKTEVQNIQHEQQRIEELTKRLEAYKLQDKKEQQEPNIKLKPDRLNGFMQNPIQVTKATLLYPTWEAIYTEAFVIGTGAISGIWVAAHLIGSESLGWLSFVIGEAAVVGLLFLRKKQENNLTNFFKVVKTGVTKEKVLDDGTYIKLGGYVGEFHLSGITRMWRLFFEKNRTKRALIISEGVLAGLIQTSKAAEVEDKQLEGIIAFKGTSNLVNPKIAQRFGFEVEKPMGFSGKFFGLLRKMDKVITLTPKGVATGQSHIAWISRQGLISHQEIIQQELDRVKRAPKRRGI